MAEASSTYSFVLGYPDPTTGVPDLTLVAGASYTFSYQLSGQGVALEGSVAAGGQICVANVQLVKS